LLLLGRGPGHHEWPALTPLWPSRLPPIWARFWHTLRQMSGWPYGRFPHRTARNRPFRPANCPGRRANRLASELEIAQNRARQAERRAAEARKQAEDLATTVEALEKIQPQADPAQIQGLEAEMESLRESLVVAEEAMAMAAASEGGLSTEWIMMTITRYSGQLEEAQAQIQQLQQELEERSQAMSQQIVASLAQELRTPMTSIGGYTELLLSESVGMLGSRQREFLQRVQANVERMNALINQLVQLTNSEASRRLTAGTITADLHSAIDTAVQSVLNQVRDKKLI
jgi:signal transduction histidine kinase